MALRRKRNLVREIREARGLSGYDLQLLSGISAAAIYLIERGIQTPQPHHKLLLAEALGTEADALFPHELARNSEIEGLPPGLEAEESDGGIR